MFLKLKKFEIFASRNVSTDKLRFRIGKHWFIFYHVKKPDVFTVGVSNETEDGYYVPFIDYDNIKFTKLEREIGRIRRRFDLSSLVVLKTYEEVVHGREVGNYHVVGLDKLTFGEHEKLLDFTSCDDNFRRAPKYYSSKSWVLRIYPKADEGGNILRNGPSVKDVVLSDGGCSRQQSLAFHAFLRNYYSVELPAKNVDGYSKIRLVEYATCKR